METVNNKWRI